MRFKLILLALFVGAIQTNAQSISAHSSVLPSSRISIGLSGGQYPLGITYGQLVTDRFFIGISTSVFSSGAGFQYYFTNPRLHRINVYSGLNGMINYDGFPMVYLPVGLSYFGKKNFIYSVDIGGMYAENVTLLNGDSKFSPWFGVRVGYGFGKDVESLRKEEKTARQNILSIHLGGFDILGGIVYERLVTPYWGIEAALGFIGASVGTRFYSPSIAHGHLNFHAGISQSIGITFLEGYTGTKTYLPLGINLLAKNDFRYSFDLGPQIWYWDNNDILLSFSFRVGKAF